MPSFEDLRRTYPEIRADYTIDQNWAHYTPDEHATWRLLFDRQAKQLPRRACDEFLSGLKRLDLGAGAIPDLDRLSDALEKLTGWRVVPVPCIVPDAIFFEHLANRRFPAGQFIRSRKELDYIEAPDVFHDVFGHVPMLAHPVFADYMEAYGRGGQRALAEFGALENLARLYWYTVEFGLIEKPEGLRIYGSGIVSSHGESIYALESPMARRVRFELERVMRTRYKIDDFQAVYFVIRSFDELFAETLKDFASLYARLAGGAVYEPGEKAPGDRAL